MGYLKKYYKYYILVVLICFLIIIGFSLYFSIDWLKILKDWQTLLAVVFSTIVTLLIFWKQDSNNKRDKEIEKKNFENAVASAIYEELTGLYNCYYSDFKEAILDIPTGEYMTTTFTITQDFFTIYHNNASNIGMIERPEIAKSIVKVYILLKKFIEGLRLYENNYEIFMSKRREFISIIQMHRNKDSYSGFYIDDEYIINELSRVFMTKFPKDSYTNVINSVIENLNRQQDPIKMGIFLASDKKAREYLVTMTNEMKKSFVEVKTEIIKTTEMINEKYDITSDSNINNINIESNCIQKNKTKIFQEEFTQK